MIVVSNTLPLILVDDQKARFVINNLNMKYIGTIGVLLQSLKIKLIKYNEFKNLLNKLIIMGYRIDINIYTDILIEAENYKWGEKMSHDEPSYGKRKSKRDKKMKRLFRVYKKGGKERSMNY